MRKEAKFFDEPLASRLASLNPENDHAPEPVAQHTAKMCIRDRLPLCRVRRLRVRESGADVFMDITVEAPATLRLDAAHDVSCVIEDIAHEIVPSADITVHVEPAQEETESMLQLVRTVAAAHKLSVHNLILSEQSGGLLVFLHVEASPDMTLREAHE